MTRSRVHLRLAATVTSLALALAGCAKIDNSQQQNQPSGPVTDDRPIKAGGTLRVALDSEPDKLDPTLSRTLVGREVMETFCEKLYQADDKLNVKPQLAAAMPDVSQDGKTVTIKLRTGLKFADGTVMDANAVKMSLDRHLTLPGSGRKSEIGPVTDVTVVDPATVALHLSQPYTPLIAQFTDRTGMVMSPKQIAAKGADFGTAPVCIGPFKFSLRVAQDRIEVVKDPNYYDAASIKLDKIIFKTITDASTRFTNLRSGDIDVQWNVSPINVDELKTINTLHLVSTDSIGYQGITLNIANSAGVAKPYGALGGPYASPLSSDARVRQAFQLSLDREALTRTVFRGVYTPACGPISQASPLASDAAMACPPHDPAQAKKLLSEAGVPTPVKVSLTIINDPDARRIGEALKSMAAEGGFDVELEPTEFASSLDMTDAGKYQMFRIGWSGQVDADGNVSAFVQTGGSRNISGYSDPEMDAWVTEARGSQDVARRKELYGKVITKIQQDVPLIYLYRTKNLVGVSNKVGGVILYSDAVLRLAHAGFVQ